MAKTIDIASPARTQAILNQYGLRAKKKFGQNFLTDGNILSGIVQAADLTKEDLIVEIGPGIGGLTEYLARAAKKVLAFEIDPDMVKILAETLAPYDNVQIVEQDVLEADLKTVLAESFGEKSAVKVVANLPYYITTPILLALLQAGIHWEKLVVMMQKEVADRLSAKPGTKEYGVLTVMLDYYASVAIALKVPAKAFNPAPNVDSAVVTLTPKPAEKPVDHPKQLFSLVKACFAHRRKSLWNNLLQRFGKEEAVKEGLTQALQLAEIDPGIRAERLTLADFTRLYEALKEKKVLQ
ncbi:16S rRNA (adenine(1518)-N(6)/adenine(1519)-N(6))-dimethyltransferase RsmA [Fructobacillus fructosus]|uniref:Ribosomal RNA small subunit methyltransferase A n=1 Tax=Fructobacillus fructosus TaxID=1631 RepID=A0ABN9YS04_9LACO|nr:16S rRNA (adenine(1518)-N(6)/adenine(1519)-N(6))-dimethyltransferase RsmA [Fructobacillus fructosus]MBD9364989.1 16S rRNA (adenine(1518)-N(6)/adenine(1519)-N(6))-dimethyltransferase RsmA [Leuconostoc mesenteroides]MBC9118512.1 16S rRNA (adenine(1518)-N(6)/adenine(1519)-N(6))-dimethyltransferase RsmA [Fructobacillus fructosus]CAK1230789.1 16S rRNA A1518 and A1519 N6-dimethyltransferase RsmA/KsgA/DIM1 (may also have DNA glycosylase/AP lyase activity) (RsmA) [Fructobacillus fructosus]CAK1231260